MAVVIKYATCPAHGLQPHVTDQPNHVLHLVLTVLTGFWAFVWLAVSIKQRPLQCQACVGQMLTGHAPLALPPGPAGVPPPRIHPTSELRHIQVTVVADSVAGLYVTARNQRDEVIRLCWDESTCTAPGGRALGRLIKKGNALMGVQPPTPILTEATLVESCVPEGGLPMGSTGQGKLLLVFETALGKESWQATIHYGVGGDPPKGDAYR